LRYALQSRARSLGIAGWVKNERDGSVAAVLEGPRERVESLVEWCGRGPSGAEVDGVDAAWEEPEGLTGFTVH